MATAVGEYRVGRKVHLVLKSKTKVDGVVFAVDMTGNRIVVEENIPGSPSTLRDTRVVNLAAVENATFDQELVPIEPLTALTKDLAARREKAAFVTREEALLIAGRRDTLDSLSRQVFDTFSKTYECRWHEREKKIEIKELDVTIRHPFRSSDVAGRDARAVKYVKDLIEKMHLPK